MEEIMESAKIQDQKRNRKRFMSTASEPSLLRGLAG
jgi:hypothetical protein